MFTESWVKNGEVEEEGEIEEPFLSLLDYLQPEPIEPVVLQDDEIPMWLIAA